MKNTAGYHSMEMISIVHPFQATEAFTTIKMVLHGPNPEAPTASNQNVSAYIPNFKLIFY
jgi:hypothetical protein